ncbi:MAG TPA: hypothetical protein PKL08_17475 [Thermoanaerobaculaceae bacterium]|nr:hypothetical protein [Thermoanaerobaculaceae bacterium]
MDVEIDGVFGREQEIFERAHAINLVLTFRLAPTMSYLAMRLVHIYVHDHV